MAISLTGDRRELLSKQRELVEDRAIVLHLSHQLWKMNAEEAFEPQAGQAARTFESYFRMLSMQLAQEAARLAKEELLSSDDEEIQVAQRDQINALFAHPKKNGEASHVVRECLERHPELKTALAEAGIEVPDLFTAHTLTVEGTEDFKKEMKSFLRDRAHFILVGRLVERLDPKRDSKQLQRCDALTITLLEKINQKQQHLDAQYGASAVEEAHTLFTKKFLALIEDPLQEKEQIALLKKRYIELEPCAGSSWLDTLASLLKRKKSSQHRPASYAHEPHSADWRSTRNSVTSHTHRRS